MNRHSNKFWIVPALSILYLLLTWVTIGLRNDHYMLIVLVNALYFSHESSRRFLYGFSIFIAYWILYDYMKLLPNFQFRPVSIRGIYELEKSIFGVHENGSVVTLNEYFHVHRSQFLDVLCPVFYLCWIPVPVAFAWYLYGRDKDTFIRYSFLFFFTNLIGWLIYYSVPAAPPWYVREYGFVFHPDVHGNAAGLLRFDDYFQINLFRDLYTKASNVFAAMPSLHAAYPVFGLYYSFRIRKPSIIIFFIVITTGIWFSAIYLDHHYLLDVIAGICVSILGIFIFEKFMLRNERIRKWFNSYQKVLQPPVKA